MFNLKDILEILDRWPKWKRIQDMPEKLDTLQKRVEELEKRLERCPGEGCPKCGELTYRVVSIHPHHSDLGDLGLMVRQMKCERCGLTEDRIVK